MSCDEYTCQDLANCPSPSSSGSQDGAVASDGGGGGDDAGGGDSIESLSTQPASENSGSTNASSDGVITTDELTSNANASSTTEEGEHSVDAGPDSSVPTCSEVCIADFRCADGSPEVCEPDANGCAQWVAHAVCTACAGPAAVAPLSPMRGAYTGSLHAESERATLRPTLTWTDASVDCGEVVYQVQLDHSCAPGALDSCEFDSPEVDVGVSDARYQPTEDLPVRREVPVGALYAWRVRACAWETECSDWSSVAYLHVGRTEQDVNGDGYADMLLAGTDADSNSVLDVYLGGAIVADSPSARISVGNYVYPAVPRFVGDVDSDGFADLALVEGAYDLCSSSGANVGIIHGSDNLEEVLIDHLCRTAGTPSTTLAVSSSGDMDGDGYADVAVAHDFNSSESRVYVLRGGETFSTVPALDLDIVPAAPFLHTSPSAVAMAGGGDFNGDSYADVVLSASGATDELLTGRLLFGAGELLPPSLTSVSTWKAAKATSG